MRCTGMYSAGWGGKDEQKVRRNATQLAKAATVVEALGGDHVTTSGDGRQGDAGGLDRVIACAQLVVEQLPPDCGVKLTMEPHYGNILMYPEDFATVLDAVADPRIGICIDTGHFHRAGVDTIALIRRFAPRIYGAHFKDVLGSRAVGIGRGEIDLGAIISALEEVGYRGDLNLELEVEDRENIPRYIEEAYFYISGLLNKKLYPRLGAG